MARSRDPEGRPEHGLSRRDFISRGAGVALSTPIISGVATAEANRAAAAAKTVGPGKVPITLRINGKNQKLNLEPRVTLLDALRDYLDLTGAKKVCDRATCGACTVLIDGRSVYACSVLAIDAQGQDIATIEGLAPGADLHPIQAAFVENDAQQCGFCTPGFVMACKEFLDRNPDPSMEDIERGLGGNICRCGTYVGIRQAVHGAAGTLRGGGGNG